MFPDLWPKANSSLVPYIENYDEQSLSLDTSPSTMDKGKLGFPKSLSSTKQP
jgi:hypothetical protein